MPATNLFGLKLNTDTNILQIQTENRHKYKQSSDTNTDLKKRKGDIVVGGVGCWCQRPICGVKSRGRGKATIASTVRS